MFVNICVNKIFKSKWLYIIVGIIVLVFIVLLNFKIEVISFGKRLKNIEVMLDMPYSAEYDLTVVSNKNVNTYFVKETYSKDEHIFEYLDSVGERSYIIVKGDTITIKNDGQKNIFEKKLVNIDECRISYSSLSKAYCYVLSEKNKCDCAVKTYEKDDVISVYFTLCGKSQEEFCLNNILKDDFISQIQVEFDKKTMYPNIINILDKNKNVLNCIVYTKFEYKEWN